MKKTVTYEATLNTEPLISVKQFGDVYELTFKDSDVKRHVTWEDLNEFGQQYLDVLSAIALEVEAPKHRENA